MLLGYTDSQVSLLMSRTMMNKIYCSLCLASVICCLTLQINTEHCHNFSTRSAVCLNLKCFTCIRFYPGYLILFPPASYYLQVAFIDRSLMLFIHLLECICLIRTLTLLCDELLFYLFSLNRFVKSTLISWFCRCQDTASIFLPFLPPK